jgi:hypothetical protein
LGERRQLSPNDARVIHCDLLAEREVQDVPKHIDQNPNLVRRTFKDLLAQLHTERRK